MPTRDTGPRRLPRFGLGVSGLGLERVPGFPVEEANRGRDRQIARQLASEDKLNHVGLVAETAQRRVGGAVQFEREEVLQAV
jgi:hypothetical protein